MQSTMTIKKLALVFTGIILFLTAYSQEKYLPGYVINLKGDTTIGLIDYRNWKVNPSRINFREKIDNNQIVYKPSDISEFKVKDEIYVSAVVDIETSLIKDEQLSNDPAIHLKKDTVFLQTIIKGSKSLYYYYNYDRDFFYIKSEADFQLLKYKRYLKEAGGQSSVVQNKAYLGQLAVYLSGCPDVESKLNTTDYIERDINSLFSSYFKCTNGEILFKKEAEKISVNFGLLAGVSITSLEFHGSGHKYLLETDYNKSINPSGGLFCEFVLPRNQGKWSIYNELLYSAYNVNGSYEEYTSADIYSITSTELGFTYLKINNLVRFKYPVGKLYLFVNGGITNGFIIGETNSKSVFTKFHTQETTEKDVALEDTRQHEMGLIIGLGLKARRYSLETRFETGNGMSKFVDLTGATRRIYLLLGYRF